MSDWEAARAVVGPALEPLAVVVVGLHVSAVEGRGVAIVVVDGVLKLWWESIGPLLLGLSEGAVVVGSVQSSLVGLSAEGGGGRAVSWVGAGQLASFL